VPCRCKTTSEVHKMCPAGANNIWSALSVACRCKTTSEVHKMCPAGAKQHLKYIKCGLQVQNNI